jgi:hypothetical protein
MCPDTTLDILISHTDLIGAVKANKLTKKQHRLEAYQEETKVESIMKGMESLDIMKDEMAKANEIKVTILEKLL